MSNQIIPQNQEAQHEKNEMFRAEQIETLKQSICKGATDVELDLFVQVCNRTGLDPFARQIFAVKRWDSREKREVMSVQVSIDGFRLVAQRSGKYRGQLGPFWCAGDGVWRDVWLSPEPPAAAKVAVLHADFAEPLWAVARFDAYAQTNRTGGLNPMWAKMGDIMIAKCFDEETEVLTDQGFQKFSEVSGRVLQVTDQGLEATGAVPFFQEYHGDMIQLDSDDLNFSVTPNHDMITTEGKIEAGVMFEEARSRPKFSIPRSVRNNNPDFPISDEQLKLCAAVVSDGQELSSGNFLIAVSRERKVRKLETIGQYQSRGVRERAGYVAVTKHRDIVTKSDQDKFTYSKECVAPLVSEGRTINTEVLLKLSQRQAKVLTDAWVFFDGNKQKKSGVRRFYTSRLDHLRAFELAAVLAGYAVSNVKKRVSDISKNPNFYVTISERDAIQVRRWGREYLYPKKTGDRKHTGLVKVQNDSGKVWCVTVPSGVIVVRRNGFSMICGNCAEALALRKAFPNELSGLYTNDEMAQSDNDAPQQALPQPTQPAQPPAEPTDQLHKLAKQLADQAADVIGKRPKMPREDASAESIRRWIERVNEAVEKAMIEEDERQTQLDVQEAELAEVEDAVELMP